jgi:hypothetical protein
MECWLLLKTYGQELAEYYVSQITSQLVFRLNCSEAVPCRDLAIHRSINPYLNIHQTSELHQAELNNPIPSHSPARSKELLLCQNTIFFMQYPICSFQ